MSRPEPDAPASALPPGAAFARGTAVAVNGRALLITGPSGAGKSSLALELVSRGARLVADDGVILMREPGGLTASAPPATRGLIEARGLGILRAPHTPGACLRAVVDLAQREVERLPPERRTVLHGVTLRLFHDAGTPSFAAALHLYLLCNAE